MATFDVLLEIIMFCAIGAALLFVIKSPTATAGSIGSKLTKCAGIGGECILGDACPQGEVRLGTDALEFLGCGENAVCCTNKNKPDVIRITYRPKGADEYLLVGSGSLSLDKEKLPVRVQFWVQSLDEARHCTIQLRTKDSETLQELPKTAMVAEQPGECPTKQSGTYYTIDQPEENFPVTLVVKLFTAPPTADDQDFKQAQVLFSLT